MRALRFLTLLLVATIVHAQQEGVDCAPIQGNGWQGCQPINNDTQQQLQAPQPSPQKWVNHYGAIATDEPHGVLGASTDMPDRQSAENTAMENCHAKGGVNCTMQISYGNQCVALVVGGKIFNVNSGPTIAEATQKGMDLCTPVANDCHAYYTACSLPQRIQ